MLRIPVTSGIIWQASIVEAFTSRVGIPILVGIAKEVFLTDKIPTETAPIPAKRLEHVALAVPDLQAAITFFSKTFGLAVSEMVVSPEQGVRMAYVDLGNAKLELMEPVGDASPIAKFVSQNPSGGIHHICIETDDAEKAIAGAGGAGLRVLGDGTAKPGHHGKKLFFLHPKDTLGALMEIEETDE